MRRNGARPDYYRRATFLNAKLTLCWMLLLTSALVQALRHTPSGHTPLWLGIPAQLSNWCCRRSDRRRTRHNDDLLSVLIVPATRRRSVELEVHRLHKSSRFVRSDEWSASTVSFLHGTLLNGSACVRPQCLRNSLPFWHPSRCPFRHVLFPLDGGGRGGRPNGDGHGGCGHSSCPLIVDDLDELKMSTT